MPRHTKTRSTALVDVSFFNLLLHTPLLDHTLHATPVQESSLAEKLRKHNTHTHTHKSFDLLTLPAIAPLRALKPGPNDSTLSTRNKR